MKELKIQQNKENTTFNELIENKSTKRNKALKVFGLTIGIVISSIVLPQDVMATQLPVGLGASGNYVILAKSGISAVPPTAVTGNMGVSPIDSTAVTGFSLILDSTTAFATSSQVVGKVYAPDYASPTPANLTTAVSDMQTAFADAFGRTLPDHTELGSGDIGGMTLAPGLYKWSTGVTIPTDVTLEGGANAVWIFQIAGNLTMAGAKSVILSGGAQARNIFWQVSGGVGVDIGTTAHFEGIILAEKGINLQTGASINGRLLAQTAVSLDANAVTIPNVAATISTEISLQRTDDAVRVWKIEGASLVENVLLRNGTPATGWRAFGRGDFNGDGQADVAFQNKVDGRLAVWFMNGTNFIGRAIITNGPSSVWHAVSAADFNNDGKADILFQNDNRSSAVWLMDGTNLTSSIRLRNGVAPVAGWRIAGTGDFNGDGKTDLLWQNKDGRTTFWFLNNGGFLGSAPSRNVGLSMHIFGAN